MKSKENIEQLLRQFMNPQDARAAARDIETGDSLFEECPAPAVSSQRVGDIQSQVRRQLRKRHQTHQFVRWGFAAAVFAAVLLAGLRDLHKNPVNPAHSSSSRLVSADAAGIWNELSTYDLIAAKIEVELTDVAASMDAMESDTPDNPGSLSIETELEELERIASNTDFWKG